MLFKTPLCILDTETTGLDFATYAQTIELAAVILNCDGTEAAHFQSLVKPTILDERANPALAVNKIDAATLQTAPDATTVACLFVKWLFDHDTRYLTAYNVKFDRAALEQLGITFADDETLKWASCIMETAKAHMKLARSPKLAAAALHYGVTVEGEAHRALTDARTAAKVAVAIQKARKGI